MYFPAIYTISLLATLIKVSTSQITVPVPWSISDLSISNIRHGTGGFWSFDIVDTPTPTPQGFNTTCSYNNPTTYIFALDGAPSNEPCTDPSVHFGLFSQGYYFLLNITHTYFCSTDTGTQQCVDSGNWKFSYDDVRGQEDDARNNFGQAGYFSHGTFEMYPKRAVPSSECEFC